MILLLRGRYGSKGFHMPSHRLDTLTHWTEDPPAAVSRIAAEVGANSLKPAPQELKSNEAVASSLEGDAPTGAGASLAQDDELEWVSRAGAGDAEAFRCLVERHRDRVYGLALRIVGSAPEAEEVAQDCFVRAWRALPRFRGESRFSTWLHRIVIRRALDYSAALNARRGREIGLDAAEHLAATGAGSAEATSDDSRRLERLMARLPDIQRAVLALFYYEDRSVEEVARTLGIPTGTVKTHLHRARAELREGWVRGEREWIGR